MHVGAGKPHASVIIGLGMLYMFEDPFLSTGLGFCALEAALATATVDIQLLCHQWLFGPCRRLQKRVSATTTSTQTCLLVRA
jgi:hypothetical protein